MPTLQYAIIGVKMICLCGCNKEIAYKAYHKYVNVKFIQGHSGRVKHDGWFKEKPESTNQNTGYWRINSILSAKDHSCELQFTNQCKGEHEIHHKDKNPCNNNKSNLSILCRSHHRLIENNSITYEKPFSIYYTDSSGKRRYKKSQLSGEAL
jgi:hypothetical protein